jgi:hypothetical protein
MALRLRSAVSSGMTNNSLRDTMYNIVFSRKEVVFQQSAKAANDKQGTPLSDSLEDQKTIFLFLILGFF